MAIRTVVIIAAIAIVVGALSFGPLSGRLSEITEPVRHLANIPKGRS
jgi:hypothetical protein